MLNLEQIREYHEACVAKLDAELKVDRLENGLRVAISPTFYSPKSEQEERRDRERQLSKIIRHTTGYVLKLAMETFSVNGSKLELGSESLEEIFDVEDIQAYSVDALWQALETQYGGGQAVNLLFQSKARFLAHELGLQSSAPTIRAGHLCIDFNVRIDSFDKKYGRNRLDGYSSTRVSNVMDGLSVFAEWLGNASLKENALCEQRYWGYSKSEIISREVREIGEGVALITTGTRFTLRFTPALGERFRLFIAEFAALEPKAA